MKKRTHRRSLAWLLLVSASVLPALLAVSTAVADEEEDDAPQAGEALSANDLSKKRRAVLLAMQSDETVLINVTGRQMPASPDILNLGKKSTKALARCVSDNVDDRLRALCAQMLGRLGDKAGLSALQGATEAWDPSVRRAAIDALRRMPDPSSVGPLSKILAREDEQESNRAAALEVLGAMNDRKAVALVRKTLREEEGSLRIAAFKGLWKSRHLISHANLVSDVTYALSSTDPQLILPGTFAASELRAPELVTPLIKLMSNADTHVRNRAVYALGKIGDKAATRALLAEVPRVRESRMLNNIAFALERLDPQAFYATAGTLAAHKQAQIRMNTAFVLGDVQRPEGLPLLRAALDDKNDTVKLSAVRALGKLHSPDAASVLERYVDDPNPTLKTAAIYSIYALAGASRKDLVYDKLYQSNDPATKLEAAVALGRANDPRVTQDLVACLELRTCRLLDVDPFLRASKSPDIPGRTLLAWSKGRSELTDLVAALRPEGVAPLGRSEVQASLAHRDLPRTLVAIDLTGEMTDAQAVTVLEPLLTHENTRLRLHAAVALSRAGKTSADAVLFRELDNLPFEQLPSFVRLMSRVTEPAARQRLLPELARREGGADVPVAVAAAAVHLAWAPEAAVFRMLSALSSPSRQERDLAERYLLRNETPVVTELLRRALSREGNEAVRNQLRRILDLRADKNRTP
jgi:HEAT repeat protein